LSVYRRATESREIGLVTPDQDARGVCELLRSLATAVIL
jgi:hypothetical protein